MFCGPGAQDAFSIAMLYVAMLVAFAFTSLTVFQTVIYFQNSQKDRVWTKTFVGLLCAGDIAHQICLIQAVYFWSIKNGNDPVTLNEIPGGLFGQAILEGIIAILVQGFYAYRISRRSSSLSNFTLTLDRYDDAVGRSWLWPTPVILMSVGQAGLLALYMTLVTRERTMIGLGKLTNYAHALNSTTAATDMAIALTMTWLLLRSKTGFRRSNTVIDRLLIYCIMSGAATSLTAILVIIMLATVPATNVYFLFFFFIPKAYCNSCLLMLNQRRSIQDSSSVEWNEYSSSDHRPNRIGRIVGRPSRASHGEPQVTITMNTFTDDPVGDMKSGSNSSIRRDAKLGGALAL
ncbi:hypothetical protein BDZ89DRAFT_1116960 [Hymenopellis radicata]|nr:hypothetical protein BDZ89DRAFT_1116960 [Hymenopellis radicata]